MRGGPPMSVEDNKELVWRFVEDGDPQAMPRNVDVLHQCYADHYHNHSPLHAEHPGVHGVKEASADVGQAYPDLRLEVVHLAADGDLVFVHWRATGTHEEQSQKVQHLRHLEPSGEEESHSGIMLFRIEEGKFVEGWHYHNL